ncbi:MAG TPA: PilZ domain-containing protein [Nitrospirae bacterium]|nr:PilZ domain-containing protein [Nitrospirota bacterium]
MRTEQDKYISMRDYSRVDAEIPFDIRLINSEESRTVRSKIATDTNITYWTPPREHDDKVLADWLMMINDKLDSILMLLTFHKEGFSTLPYKKVNISGGGMSFYWNCNFPLKSVLELKMLLPIFPPVAMYVYGEVVLSESKEGGWFTAVKFINIEEDIRDEIVKFVFKKQRELLREKRK